MAIRAGPRARSAAAAAATMPPDYDDDADGEATDRPRRPKRKAAASVRSYKEPEIVISDDDDYVVKEEFAVIPRRIPRSSPRARELILLSHFRRREFAELHKAIRRFKESGCWRVVTDKDGTSRAVTSLDIRLDSIMIDRLYSELDTAARYAFAALFELIDYRRPLNAFEMQYLE